MPGPLSRADHDILAAGLKAIKDGAYIATLAGNLTLDDTYPNVLKLDPGGSARDVTLPDEATHEGVLYLVVNGADAAENLVFKDSGTDTIGTVNQNEAGLFYCDGTAATGWKLLCVWTIALT